MSDFEEKSASDWYAQLSLGEPDEKMRQEFDAWLAKSDKNELAYKECEKAMSVIEKFGSHPDVAQYVQDIGARYKLNECDLAGGYKQKVSPFRKVFADVAKWFGGLADLKKQFPVVASFSAMSIICAVLLLQSNSVPAKEYYHTAIGEQEFVELSDGSHVTLNTATTLHVEYDKHQRRLDMLAGEAVFSVSTDPGRPFDVVAGNVVVRAIGTRFNVQIQGDILTVSVLEGVVNILGKATGAGVISGAMLYAGYAVSYKTSDGTQVSAKEIANTHRIDAWLRGQLEFDRWRLEEAVAEHNRYAERKIVIGNSFLRDMEITGIFQIGDTESLSAALQAMLPVKVSYRQNTIVFTSDGSPESEGMQKAEFHGSDIPENYSSQ